VAVTALAGYHGRSGRRATLYGAAAWMQSPRWRGLAYYIESRFGLAKHAELFAPGTYHSRESWFVPAGAVLEIWDAAP